MNQMTVVEVLDPVDRYTISGIGYGLEGKVHHAAGASPVDRRGRPALHHRQRRQTCGRQGCRRPDRGRPAGARRQGGLDIDASREKFPRLATLPFDPTYKLMATFNSATDSSGEEVVRCFVKGAAPAVMGRAATALAAGASVPWDADAEQAGRRCPSPAWKAKGTRVMAAAFRDLDPATFDADGDLLGYVTDLEMTSLVAMVDPPRDESKAAVRDAQNAAHPGADGHRRRRDHRCSDREAAGHPRFRDAGYGVRRAERTRNGWPGSTTSASSGGSRPNTRCCSSRRSGRRATSSP